MAKEKVEALIEGGKATAAPPLGPALGPMGINIGQVIAEINRKTEAFRGMQVPVKIEIDKATKQFTVSVGTPPASSLIKKEARIEKGAGNPKEDKVADLRIEQIIKIAKMKEDSLTGRTLREKVKEIIGTCNSMGILVQGVPAKDAIALVNEGRFDKEIQAEKTELTSEELKQLEEERKRLEEEIKTRREEFLKKAKAILEANVGKEKGEIKRQMREAMIPDKIISEVIEGAMPAAPGAGAEAGKPAAGKPGEAKPAAKEAAPKEEKKAEKK